jgi:hypothetical protein
MALTKVTAAVIEPTAVTDNISTGSISSDKIADDAIVSAKIADDAIVSAKIADDAIVSAKIADDAIITAKIADDAVSSNKIADDAITYNKLEPRFTGKQEIATTSGTINLDTSSYAIFEFTSALTGATTLNIQNIKKGQIIDILISGSHTITLSADFTTETFNKLAEVDYDGANSNYIQMICIDDNDSDAILNYSIASYTSDPTP